MKLTEFKAHFTKYSERHVPSDVFVDGVKHNDGIERSYSFVATLAEADGIWFLCPACYTKNGGEVGTHYVAVGFRGRCPPGSYTRNKAGEDTRWDVVGGTGLDDLQLAPSIQIEADPICNWHGFVGSSGRPPGEAW